MKTCGVWSITVLAAVCAALPALGAEEAEVTGSRVNLRAAPVADAEVAGQVDHGDRVRVRAWGPEWVEIVPPDGLRVWVHADFIEDGVVKASVLNVRAGPGIAHRQIGQVERGIPVRVRETFGEWLGIDPPETVSLWISREYVRDIRPPPPPPPPVPPRPPEPESAPPPSEDSVAVEDSSDPRPIPVTPSILPRAPDDLDLDPEVEQGRIVEQEGVVRRVGFLLRRPARFRLVSPSGGRRDMICYVRGDREQLAALDGLAVRIRGRLYTTRSHRYPVVLADKIYVLP